MYDYYMKNINYMIKNVFPFITKGFLKNSQEIFFQET